MYGNITASVKHYCDCLHTFYTPHLPFDANMAITILATAAKTSAMIVIFSHLISIASALPTDASALESSISALEKAVITLESSSDWWDKSLPWFTGLVVLGLIADLVVVVWERIEEMTGWHRWVLVGIHFPDRPTRGRFILELLATAAIFLGVAGEFWAGINIAYINGQLRSKNAELRSESDQLVALLGQETAELENANLELEALIQPRGLTVEQQKAIGTELRKFSGRRVIIAAYPDAEAMRLGQIIADAVKGAGISSDMIPRTDTTEFPMIGVAVSGDEKRFVKALQDSLLSKGRLEPSPKSPLKVSSNVLMQGIKPFIVVPSGIVIEAYVLIGLKPLPQLEEFKAYVLDQGPRAKLLNEAAPGLASKLTPFSGQRVSLFVCGDHRSADQETFDTWAAIANILDTGIVSGITGAKWNLVPTNLNFVTVGCGAAKDLGQGVMVFVSKDASRRTMEAANALGHGIANILPPSLNKMPSLVDPTFSKSLVDRGLQDKNLPWISVGLDPDLITVLIGAHP
jgi:hypothetical protein